MFGAILCQLVCTWYGHVNNILKHMMVGIIAQKIVALYGGPEAPFGLGVWCFFVGCWLVVLVCLMGVGLFVCFVQVKYCLGVKIVGACMMCLLL